MTKAGVRPFPDRETAEMHMDGFIRALGFDPDKDPHFNGTAKRVVKMYCEELFAGSYTDPPHMTSFDDPDIAVVPSDDNTIDEMIFSGPLRVRSTCSHHMLPITGEAYVAIILDPAKSNNLPGLSKYGRIVDYFASRPQVQERLTKQVADYLEELLEPKGLAVMVRAKHMCQCHRGMQQHDAMMGTTALRGIFRTELSAKTEFLQNVRINQVK